MKTPNVYAIAKKLMTKHGLLDEGWTFAVDRAKARCGCTEFRRKKITISRYYLSDKGTTLANIHNTLLHEIAHALVGWEAAHGDVWKSKALEIGCDGTRCDSHWHGAKPPYIIGCWCGRINAYRYRLPNTSRRACMNCSVLHVTPNN
jgi:hypothetical protein